MSSSESRSESARILLFPGQGTEAVGMSAGWEAHGAWRRTVEAAEAHTGSPLKRLMAEGPLEELRRQRHAPFAVLAHSVGIFRARREAGMPLPVAATGHSMGFYSALVAAGVVPLEAALALISAVEDLSAAAFADTPMGMAFVIGVAEAEVRQALSDRADLVLSNRNGRAQFTVSGPLPSLEGLVETLRPSAMKVGLLPVRHPLHGPHMAALLPALARRLTAVEPAVPAFPLISHFDGRLIVDGRAAWDEGLASVALPVDWLAVVARLKTLSAPLAECGHGTQLSGLTRWAERGLVVDSLQLPPQPS
ncbi:malonyl CoA-acyl carrier protein transacylase [Geothrix oryzae]|uniref:[acyl-carrier-protein] S-malonyltransferase n=1 Tax=Geothrix oryzae TaxID=2927975 RepID=A0ABN6V1H4_9BACT|nr:ACP S-malonyltransferase [Geothrix oryzae]BDU69904.1 malonyl CoA-acyl carrier protein transacylase [Geothrix oryzae]